MIIAVVEREESAHCFCDGKDFALPFSEDWLLECYGFACHLPRLMLEGFITDAAADGISFALIRCGEHAYMVGQALDCQVDLVPQIVSAKPTSANPWLSCFLVPTNLGKRHELCFMVANEVSTDGNYQGEIGESSPYANTVISEVPFPAAISTELARRYTLRK